MSLAGNRGRASQPGRSRFDDLRFRIAAELGRDVAPEEVLSFLLDYAEGDEATFLRWLALQERRAVRGSEGA